MKLLVFWIFLSDLKSAAKLIEIFLNICTEIMWISKCCLMIDGNVLFAALTKSKAMLLVSTSEQPTPVWRLWRARHRRCWRTAKVPGQLRLWLHSRVMTSDLLACQRGDKPSPTPRIHCMQRSVWLDGDTTMPKWRKTCMSLWCYDFFTGETKHRIGSTDRTGNKLLH